MGRKRLHWLTLTRFLAVQVILSARPNRAEEARLNELRTEIDMLRSYVGCGALWSLRRARRPRAQGRRGASTSAWSGCVAWHGVQAHTSFTLSPNARLPQHPHIIGFLGDVCSGDRLAVFLELSGYGCLQSLIESYGALVPQAVSRYARHVTEGLSFLHGHGVIHRDVKGKGRAEGAVGGRKAGAPGGACKGKRADTSVRVVAVKVAMCCWRRAALPSWRTLAPPGVCRAT